MRWSEDAMLEEWQYLNRLPEYDPARLPAELDSNRVPWVHLPSVRAGVAVIQPNATLLHRLPSQEEGQMRTHCKRGHEYTERDVLKGGVRRCRVCRKLAEERLPFWLRIDVEIEDYIRAHGVAAAMQEYGIEFETAKALRAQA